MHKLPDAALNTSAIKTCAFAMPLDCKRINGGYNIWIIEDS